jgi:xylulokinase
VTYLLGIDVSTTATKTILVDEQGSVVGTSATEYGFDTPFPLWSEQDPPIWWYGAIQSMRRMFKQTGVDPKQVAAIGLTGQMHGLVPLNEAGSILRPAILWNDQRTGPQCDEIRARVGKERLIRITGNDALAGFTAPKILWLREHEPEIWKQVRTVLLPKDYLRFRLTHHYATDKADGSGMLLMDLAKRKWSSEILSDLDIPPSYLPPAYEGPEITSYLTHGAAGDTGMLEGTPVIAGGGDQAAQAVGVGAVREGIIALTLGTSGVVFATVNQPYYEPEGRLHAFCHSVPDRWHLMGTLAAGASSSS